NGAGADPGGGQRLSRRERRRPGGSGSEGLATIRRAASSSAVVRVSAARVGRGVRRRSDAPVRLGTRRRIVGAGRSTGRPRREDCGGRMGREGREEGDRHRRAESLHRKPPFSSRPAPGSGWAGSESHPWYRKGGQEFHTGKSPAGSEQVRQLAGS